MSTQLKNGCDCTMMNCMCMESCECEDNECPIKNGEWFPGACLNCEKSIEDKEDAKRMPRIQGGWSGSYCSWKCVEIAVEATGGNSIGRKAILEKIKGQERSLKAKQRKANANKERSKSKSKRQKKD